MALRRSSSRRPTQRRKLVWARQSLGPADSISFGAGTIYPLLTSFQSSYGADPIGSTIRRIRGNFSLRAGTAGLSIRATIGIAVINGVGTVANQGPANAPHLDWMYWSNIFAEPVVATEFTTMNMIPLDVRAMRKMEELGQDLVLVIQNTHPSSNVAFHYATSTLLSLP